MPFGLGTIIGAGKVAGGFLGIGGGRREGTLWDRRQHIRPGETLTPGGDEIDQAYADKLNRSFDADIRNGTRAAHIWTGYDAAWNDLVGNRQNYGPTYPGQNVTAAVTGGVPTIVAGPTGLAAAAGSPYFWPVAGLLLFGAIVWHGRGRQR
jgi:hypothetical protein